MPGSVFIETLRRHWRGLVFWAVSIASLAVYIIAVKGDSKMLQQYGELLKTMPSFLLNMVGGGDVTFIASQAGFLAYGFFGWIMIVLAVYAVMGGLNITANDEDRGILDVVLSLPLPRWRIVVEKFLAYTVSLLIILATSFVVLGVAVASDPGYTIGVGRLLESIVNMLPSLLLVMAFTALISVVVRRRSTAVAIAATFVAASYLVDVIGRSAQAADVLRNFSYYKYYDSTAVMQNGINVGNFMFLTVIAALMFAGALYAFQRRDVGL